MEKKVALITGGGKGIGFGIAAAFIKNGYNIVITGRNFETLEIAKEKLEKISKNNVLIIKADGSIENDVKNVVKETIKKFGKINVLINNAQSSKSGLLLIEHTKEDFSLAINSGIYSTFFYMKECFPYLKETMGSVINFASSAGFFGKVGQASYAASKEGIRGLSRVAATEWGQYGINVNIIAPLVETEQLLNWKQEYPELYHQTIQNIPMGKFGNAEKNIGKTCLFLASDDGKYISGETISIQGGAGLRP